MGWCCIPAVPELIPFLFAELQALAAASQSLEQTARMVEGLGKHAWYFPSFPPPPPPPTNSSPALSYFQSGICGLSGCRKGCNTVCFCHLFLLEVGKSRRTPLHPQQLAEPHPVVCRAAKCGIPSPCSTPRDGFHRGIPNPFPSLHAL